MHYEQTAVKNNTKEVSKKMLILASQKLSTPRLLYIIVSRHKVFILATGNVILILNYIFPLWFTFLTSLF